MTISTPAIIAAMPKAELHLHIEGTLEPDMMLELALRNGVTLPQMSIEDIRKAYRFSSLQDFLDLYYQGMQVLRTAKDFHDLTFAYLQRAHSQNIVHSEIFFDPQGHTTRGVAFETVLDGICDALQRVRKEFGLTSRLIMCFLRHLPEDAAMETLQQARAHTDRIFGVGLDSSELGHPPAKFENVFRAAREAGFAVVAHAGEEGPPDYVTQALDILQVSRIDHGIRALEDDELTRRLSAMGMPLTICPLSNLRLGVVDDMKNFPLRKMLDAGLCVTINSDDPAYFGGYMAENFTALDDALSLSAEDVLTLGRNGFEAAFMEDGEKAKALAAFDEFAAKCRDAHQPQSH